MPNLLQKAVFSASMICASWASAAARICGPLTAMTLQMAASDKRYAASAPRRSREISVWLDRNGNVVGMVILLCCLGFVVARHAALVSEASSRGNSTTSGVGGRVIPMQDIGKSGVI